MRYLGFILLSFSVLGCQPARQTLPENFATCPDQRSQICTFDYSPVCALRDKDAKCDAPPCTESLEAVTRSNACVACSDAKVAGYTPGECQTH